jgi:hypothetical protein
MLLSEADLGPPLIIVFSVYLMIVLNMLSIAIISLQISAFMDLNQHPGC